jgi:hypothetical protein
MTLTLYDVPADVSGSISFGSATPITISAPGQNALLSFTGAANQRVSLRITSSTLAQSYISMRKPDGTWLFTPEFITGASAFIDTKTLPVAGTYVVVVDAYDANIGGMTLTLYDVPPDASGTGSVGGGTVPLSVTVPGQNASMTFAGTSSQQVTVRMTGNSMGFVTLRLLRANGTVVTTTSSSSTSFNLSTVTLPATETYRVTVDPTGANLGSITIAVTSP